MFSDSALDPLEPVSVALIDIQAGLEAQLRLLTAAQVCVQYQRNHSGSDGLENCARYLDRLVRTNQMLVAALIETSTLVRGALVDAGAPPGVDVMIDPHPATRRERRTGQERRQAHDTSR